MSETNDVAPKTSVLGSDERVIQDQEARTRKTLRIGGLILGTVLLILGVVLFLTQGRATDSENNAITQADAAKSVADPVLALCAEGGDVAVRLNQSGLCGTAASVRVVAGNPGTPGATGATGASGSQGVPGAQGGTGPRGFDGPKGQEGQQGVAGINGTNGSNGTDGAPGDSIVGPKGDTGDRGPKGDTGDQGAQGSQGTPPQEIRKVYPDGRSERCTYVPDSNPITYNCMDEVIPPA